MSFRLQKRLARIGPVSQSPDRMNALGGLLNPGPASSGFPQLVALALSLLAALSAGAEAVVTDPEEGTEAQASGPVEIVTIVERLIHNPDADGIEYRPLVQESILDIGDEVQYTIRVTNPGTEPVGELVVTKRLPVGLHYVPGTAVGPDCEVLVSDDGGHEFRGATGGRGSHYIDRKIEHSHLRWILAGPLAPGATAILRFRAVFT
jgi:uncharacterized repeat protein (TIGR01451 family)